MRRGRRFYAQRVGSRYRFEGGFFADNRVPLSKPVWRAKRGQVPLLAFPKNITRAVGPVLVAHRFFSSEMAFEPQNWFQKPDQRWHRILRVLSPFFGVVLGVLEAVLGHFFAMILRAERLSVVIFWLGRKLFLLPGLVIHGVLVMMLLSGFWCLCSAVCCFLCVCDGNCGINALCVFLLPSCLFLYTSRNASELRSSLMSYSATSDPFAMHPATPSHDWSFGAVWKS